MARVSQFLLLSGLAVLMASSPASAQMITFDFENGTDQGWGTGFGDDASFNFPIVNIGGSNRMAVTHTSFQAAGRASQNQTEPFYLAMAAAAANPAGYTLSYDYYIDTTQFAGATFLQIGTFVNTGSGYYAQHFPSPPEVQLGQAELNSGQVFSGRITQTFAADGYAMPTSPPENFYRLGLILNGDGPMGNVYFDNISVAPVPEPTSLILSAIAVPPLFAAIRRRRKVAV